MKNFIFKSMGEMIEEGYKLSKESYLRRHKRFPREGDTYCFKDQGLFKVTQVKYHSIFYLTGETFKVLSKVDLVSGRYPCQRIKL